MNDRTKPEIRLVKVGTEVELTSPYVAEFPTHARKHDGRWISNKKVWSFDCRDVDKVICLVEGVYGVTVANPCVPQGEREPIEVALPTRNTGSAEQSLREAALADPSVPGAVKLQIERQLKKAAGRKWSPQQKAVIAHKGGNLLVAAGPGSGKSTVALGKAAAEQKAAPDASIIMLAFNASIAKELKEKVEKECSGVIASTFHSACNSVLGRTLIPRPKIDGDKVRRIAREWTDAGKLDHVTAEQYRDGAIRLVSAAKAVGLGTELVPDTIASWVELIDRFDVDFQGPDEGAGIELAQRLLRESNNRLFVIDFDDMLYLLLLLKLSGPKYDIVIVDEAQDMNAVQRALLPQMVKEGGRIICVGDRKQSIYGFRGADWNSMDLLKETLNAEELPLTVSFRCSQAVVEFARLVYPDIDPAPSAPYGSARSILRLHPTELVAGDGVLCRNTAPLITLAYRCIRYKVPVRVLGREIGKGLTDLIRKMKALDLDDLIGRLERHRAIEVQRLVARMQEKKAEALNDRIDCIMTAIEALPPEVKSIEGLILDIESLFADGNGEMVELATIHKAKGLEWDQVYILEPALMPSKWAKKADQLIQERNCEFVAKTRARLDVALLDLSRVEG